MEQQAGRTDRVSAMDSATFQAGMRKVRTDMPAAFVERYIRTEAARLKVSLSYVPTGGEYRSLLELGSYGFLTWHFIRSLGFRSVHLADKYDEHSPLHSKWELPPDCGDAKVDVRCFDVEADRFPYADGQIDVVLAFELLEHLAIDPMAMVAEINRVLAYGGAVVLSTPNAVRSYSAWQALRGRNPNPSVYSGVDTNRHNRLYSPAELGKLLAAAGFEIVRLDTFSTAPRGVRRGGIRHALFSFAGWVLGGVSPRLRNDYVIAVGRKTGPVAERRPAWLYSDIAFGAPAEALGTTRPQRAEAAGPRT